MSQSKSLISLWVARLHQHLQEERYCRSVARNYPNDARCFLRYLVRRGQALESISPADVEHYLDGLRRRRDRRALPASWRRAHRAAIQMLLRLVHGKWPPESAPTTTDEIAAHEMVSGYDAWMEELRGLSASTRRHGRAEAQLLLRRLRDHSKSVATLCVADLDAYIASRGVSMRRSSKVTMVSTLRGVLRYLYGSGRMPRDLAEAIEGPPIYALEGIPSTIRREDIERALKALRCDRSPQGRRDYAILMLLSTYGLRGGEIIGLRLSDIDWRHERLRIRHAKTGAYSELPLLRGPANALFDYLKHGRPETRLREVFLRALAPYRPLSSGGALHYLVSRRLQTVGVSLTGKRGAHVLRHSRAVSLLSGGVPIKVIGDVLGHRSERSTAVYLKLATDDLRAVALDLPQGGVAMSAQGTVDRFLDTQSIGRQSRYTYAGVLRAFDAFVLERASAAGRLSIGVLRAWLQQEIQQSPLKSVVHRTCVIARYLDWCSAAGGGSHPLAELRAQYGRLLNPIVRALLEDDYESALQRLRPLPDWSSVLGVAMREHITRMQSLGYRYEVQMRDLRRFDRFLQRHPDLAAASLPELLGAWRHESRGVRHQLRVQQCGRIVCAAALGMCDRTSKSLSHPRSRGE